MNSSRLVGRAVCPGADATGCLSRGQDVPKTSFAFALLTVAAQANLACLLLLEEKPAARPPAPRPACWVAWLLAVCTWASVTLIFLAYISYGGVVAPTSLEWAVWGGVYQQIQKIGRMIMIGK
ncbi:hypothetical protein E2562_015653 [Oryza meyeriana var. granulata]|uniref:Uncharacterized protein n=1 Tax=Oryza meyeriana var. granulata TaxID=110450 RepID=A0A6G1D5T3_9ORYZ|nr:hypothetical protein E2562_015653 [Oryza meyeriana var. granulata]